MPYRDLLIEWAVVLVAATVLVIAATRGGWTAPLDDLLLDHVAALHRPPAEDRILLVEIDDRSLAEIGRWPWPRSVHARAIARIADARAAAIGYDVLFLEPGQDDAELAHALRHAGSVVLPMLPMLPEGDSRADAGQQLPPPPIATAAHGLGAVDVSLDDDGVVRRFNPMAFGPTPHFSELIARMVGTASASRDPGGLIRFQPAGTIRRVAFADLVAGRVPPAFLAGRIVLVGATAPGLGDRFVVPATAGTMLSGVELQANILGTLLRHDFRHALSPAWQTLIGLAVVWALLLAFLRFGPATNLRVALAMGALVCGLSLSLLTLTGWWFAPGSTLLALVTVHSLWGWRRLAAVSRFLAARVAGLQTEPDVLPYGRSALMRGDSIHAEVDRLDHVIDQLRGLRRFVADILARLPDAVCVVDRDDTVMLGNRTAEALFGGPVKGLPVTRLLDRLGLTAQALDSEVILADGRTLVASRTPIGGEAMPGGNKAEGAADGATILRFVDVTELKSAARTRDEALQFLSHDMRAPYTAMIALLQDSGGGSEMPANATVPVSAQVLHHARRGLTLADDFVQLAKMQNAPLSCEPVELGAAATEAVDLVWPMSKARNIAVDEIGFDGDLWVMVDAAALQRALVNLLDNAVKFADPGAHVQCWIEHEGHAAIFSVTGPGPALPPERADDPFIAFAPGLSTGGRTSHGLGLAFVKAFARRHGGIAMYRAQPDSPLKTFSIRLPLIQPEAEIDD